MFLEKGFLKQVIGRAAKLSVKIFFLGGGGEKLRRTCAPAPLLDPPLYWVKAAK